MGSSNTGAAHSSSGSAPPIPVNNARAAPSSPGAGAAGYSTSSAYSGGGYNLAPGPSFPVPDTSAGDPSRVPLPHSTSNLLGDDWRKAQ